MKKLLVLLSILTTLYSCGSDEIRVTSKEPSVTGTTGGKKKPFKKKALDSLQNDSMPKELANAASNDSVTLNVGSKYIPSTTKYTGKHRELIQQILTQKRTYVMEKEGKPHHYYGDWFFDLFEVDKTPSIVIDYYEKKIDTFITICASKGDLHYDNLSKNEGSPIK